MTDVEDTPLIVEDLLLLLFDPRSGVIAGEGTLFYPLGGAVLAELALRGLAEIDRGGVLRDARVRAVGEVPPTDDLLRDVWQQVRDVPKGVQGLLAGTGTRLREPVLDRLVRAGHIVRRRRKLLGMVPATALVGGDSQRRDELLAVVRRVLVDGVDPSPRTATLAALLSASGNLPALHRDIPWSGDVYTRGKQLEQGDWGAAAVDEAVTRTVAAQTAAIIALTVTATR